MHAVDLLELEAFKLESSHLGEPDERVASELLALTCLGHPFLTSIPHPVYPSSRDAFSYCPSLILPVYV